MANNAEVGYFGKLPQRGDFVSSGLGRDFLDIWDQWLQDAIACSRDQLGDAWLDIYLTSPIWRFLLCDGICGGSAWAGVLIPSVDKVGRYYPLTIAAPLPAGSNPMQFSVLADDWFRAAEARCRDFAAACAWQKRNVSGLLRSARSGKPLRAK